MFNEIYQQMQTGFRSSRLEFLYKKTQLGRLLSEDRQPSPREFFDIFFDSSSISQVWFTFCIASHNLRYVFFCMYKTLMLLKEVNIYNHYNIELLNENRNNQFDWNWVENLHKNQLLNEDHFRLLFTQDFPSVLSDGLIHLHRAGILNPENKAQLIAHSKPIAFVKGLKCLFHSELLTSSNLSFIERNACAIPFFSEACQVCFSLEGLG